MSTIKLYGNWATQNKKGNCFEATIKLSHELDVDKDTILIVHGSVYHEIPGYHDHSWLEVGELVYDFSNGNETIMRKKDYYKLGKIKDTITYTYKQALKHCIDTEHYGPWENSK